MKPAGHSAFGEADEFNLKLGRDFDCSMNSQDEWLIEKRQTASALIRFYEDETAGKQKCELVVLDEDMNELYSMPGIETEAELLREVRERC